MRGDACRAQRQHDQTTFPACNDTHGFLQSEWVLMYWVLANLGASSETPRVMQGSIYRVSGAK
jgi:hypothetical protein